MPDSGQPSRATLRHPFDRVIGESSALMDALRAADLAASQDAAVLVIGETGTGKGVLAGYLHEYSGRRGRFETVNCAAFQPQLVEAQLFGYVKGAFTGADRDTPGILETANNGTLFLDEIGDMAHDAQAKLLRVLETGLVRRVGGTDEKPVNVRVIAATHRDLAAAIESGQFRRDLYYRINSFVIELPPLRERGDDVWLLADAFLDRSGDSRKSLDDAARAALRAFSWPGNVRELESAIAHAMAQAGTRTVITAEDLPPGVRTGATGRSTAPDHISLLAAIYPLPEPSSRQWAEFLIAFAAWLDAPVFRRRDIVAALRAVRGADLSDAALASDWHRKLKDVPLGAGLIEETQRRVVIHLARCDALLGRAPDATADSTDASPDQSLASTPRPATARVRLPDAYTSFVGRDRDLHDLIERLETTPGRLITVTGPGGIGKTRIAQELLRRINLRAPGQCAFADLSDARSPGDIALAVAQALDVPLADGDATDALGAVLEMAGPFVLVLDNFEQVVEHADATVGRWRDTANGLRLVVTSRAILGLLGEQEFQMQPLSPPPENASLDALAASPAVQLFVDRARAARPDFAIDDSNAADVAQLVQALDGLPLAVELAAARTRMMEPRQLVDGLQDALSRWSAPESTRPERQRTIEAVINWSVDLLSPRERRAFLELGVFRGGFFFSAAEAVLSRDSGASAFDLLGALRDKSLVRPMATPVETRFRLYQLLRAFACEHHSREVDPAGQQALQRRHGEHYASVVERERARLDTEDGADALLRLGLETDNVFAADDHAFATGDLAICARLLIGIDGALELRGPGDERYRRLARLFDALRSDDSAGIAAALDVGVSGALATAAAAQGDMDRASAAARHAMEAAATANEPTLTVQALIVSGATHYLLGNLADALAQNETAARLAETHGESRWQARAVGNCATILVARQSRDTPAAIAGYTRAIELATANRDPLSIARWTHARGMARQDSDPDAAVADYEAAEQIAREFGADRQVAQLVGQRGIVLAARGNLDAALACLDQADDDLRGIGDKRGIVGVLANRGRLLDRLGRSDDARRDMEEAIRLARTLQRPALLAPVLIRAGHHYLQAGDLPSAVRHYSEAATAFDTAGAATTAALARAEAADARFQLGEDVADEVAALRERLAERGEDNPRLAFLTLRLAAETGGAAGATDEVEAAARNALGIAVDQQYLAASEADERLDLTGLRARLGEASAEERRRR